MGKAKSTYSMKEYIVSKKVGTFFSLISKNSVPTFQKPSVLAFLWKIYCSIKKTHVVTLVSKWKNWDSCRMLIFCNIVSFCGKIENGVCYEEDISSDCVFVR